MSKEPFNVSAGQSYKLFFNEGNPNNKLLHVRAVVDDGYVVFKHWLQTKGRWSYGIEHISYFESVREFLEER